MATPSISDEASAYSRGSKQSYTSGESIMPIEDAAKAKALINVMMQDRFFLALYRSNDPKVRAAAMDKLNKAHSQAYGLPPIKDGDAGRAPGRR